jgi:glucose/arabinose dehydrogenase
VGLHGEVGSWRNTGVQWAPTDPTTHRPTRSTVFFVTGWGRGAGIQGRVADLTFAPDGRMFFSDDQDGAIYWVAPRSLRIPSR